MSNEKQGERGPCCICGQDTENVSGLCDDCRRVPADDDTPTKKERGQRGLAKDTLEMIDVSHEISKRWSL